MELKYRVSEDDYTRFLQERRKKRLRKPINILFTVVLTAIPLTLFAYCAARQLFNGWKLALFGLLTLALAAANLTVRLGYWRRADTELEIMKKKGDLNQDFWREHRLNISEKGVKLVSGNYSAQYEWPSFGGFEECGDMLLPIFNAQPLDIIPLQALERVGGKDRFQTDFTDIAKKALRAVYEEEQAKPHGAPVAALSYSYTKEAYLRDQRDAQRRRYTTRLIWNRAVLAKLALTAVMVYVICASTSPWMKLADCAIIFVLNYEHISTFTPPLEQRLETMLRPILALRPDHWAEIRLTRQSVIVQGDIHYLELPLSEILTVRRLPHSLALYLASQTVLTVPAPPAVEAETFESFCQAVSDAVQKKR